MMCHQLTFEFDPIVKNCDELNRVIDSVHGTMRSAKQLNNASAYLTLVNCGHACITLLGGLVSCTCYVVFCKFMISVILTSQ